MRYPVRWLCALLLAGAASALLAQSSTDELPFGLKWIIIPRERVARELEKVQQGTMLAVPLDEFKTRIERVRAALPTRDLRPRLLQSHYSAELIDHCLSGGSGHWLIRNPGSAAAIFPVESINLALNGIQWEDGGDAQLGEFEADSLGLLVTKSGNQTCLFEWSARGTPTNEGLSFHLRIPSCPKTSFEFTLPADLWLSIPKADKAKGKDREADSLVSGPYESKQSPGKRIWKIQLTGQTDLDLSLRKIADPQGAPPTLFAKVQSVQQLAPDGVMCDYDFNVDVLHGSIRELVLEGDILLQPYEVTSKNGDILGWKWKEAPAKKEPKSKAVPAPTTGLLTIQFRLPVQGKLAGLHVRALAPVPNAGAWFSPALGVRGAWSRGDTVKIQLHPQLQVSRWDSGAFQLTSVATETDGTQVIALADSAPQSVPLRRPSVILRSGGVDVLTRETNRWSLDSRGGSLTAEWDYTLLRGQLQQLAIKLPDPALGYQVEAVDLKPRELLRNWRPVGDQLIVELKQALATHKKATLTVHLHTSFQQGVPGGRIVHYPELEPMDSTKREGSLAIDVDRIYRSLLLHSSVPLAPPATSNDEKFPDASYLFTYRDQRLAASLRLIPKPVQVHLRGRQTVRLSEEGATVRFQWEAEPLLGAPEALDFRCSEGLVSSVRVKADGDSARIQRWERLYVAEALPHLLQLGSGSGLESALLAQTLPAGPLWRFYLAEPLQKKSRFTLEATLPAGLTANEAQSMALLMPRAEPWQLLAGTLAADMLPREPGVRLWSLPLMIPEQRLNVEQDIAVESVREPIVKAAAANHSLSPLTSRSAHAPGHALTFHADPAAASGSPRLLLWTRADKSSASENELCDDARLTTLVQADELSHHLQFRLWHWRQRTCVLRFPKEVQVIAARVEDRWLDHVEIAERNGAIQVTLPIDQNIPFVRCEIHLRAPRTSIIPGVSRVEALRIDWPIPPLELRRRYVVADGLVPLHQEALAPVGMPGRAAELGGGMRWLRQIWSWGESWLIPGESTVAEKLESQKETLLRVEAHLRERVPKSAPALGEVMERLGETALREGVPLLVDQLAFQELGLTPASVLVAPLPGSPSGRHFWESLGLVFVARPPGALLTSPRRLATFGLDDAADAPAIDAALREALFYGQDTSGAFVPALIWAGMPPTAPRSRFGDAAGFFADTEANPPGKQGLAPSEWGPLAGAALPDSLYVVDLPIGRLFGAALALLLAAGLWGVKRFCKPLTSLRVYLIVITASILAAYWVPSTVLEIAALPLAFVEMAGFLWLLATLPRVPHTVATGRSTLIKPAAPAAALALLIMVLPWNGSAQTPQPASYTVMILQGAQPTALVPIELATKLDEMEKPADLAGRGAILLSAAYSGKVKDQTATFDVEYQLFSRTDNMSLVIPLSGVQLQEGASMDNAPVFPTAAKNGYRLTVRDKGMHRLRLSFAVRVKPEGDSFDLRFAVPKLLQNEIAVQWSIPVQSVHSFQGYGEEKTGSDPRQPVKEWRMHLGYENAVHLRWSGTSALAVFKAIEVEEMHFWDLRPGSVSLVSSFQYRFGKGSLAQLIVTLPEGLHVRSVDALPASAAAGNSIPMAIKQWQVTGKGGQRRLLVDFAQPVTVPMTLNLELVPQFSLQAKRLPLPLPAPLQGKSVRGYVAYRLEATEESTALNLAVQSMTPADFAEVWKKQSHPEAWKKLFLPSIEAASRSYSFQRKGLFAGLELVPRPHDRFAQMDFTWQLNSHHGDLSARCTLSSPRENMILQEFVVPPGLALASVTGTEVSRWNLRDNLLQVWLRRPCKQAELEITGWHRFVQVPPVPAKTRFTLPCLYPLQTQISPSRLRVQPRPGMSLEADRLLHLRPLSNDATQFAVEAYPCEASFRMHERPEPPEVRLLTRVHRSERGIELWCGIRLTTVRGQLPPLKLHLKDWPCESLLFDAPSAFAVRLPTDPGEHTWSIRHVAGLPQHVFVILRGQITKNIPAAIKLPTIELDHISFPPKARYLAWKDMDIVDPLKGKKIADALVLDKLPDDMRDFAFGTSAGWKYLAVNRPLRAVLPKTPSRLNVSILGTTEHVRLDRQQWLHEADWWIQVPAATTLHLNFPVPVESFCVFLGDELRVAQTAAGRECLLPVPAAAEPQHLRVRWKYADDTLDSPRLEPVSLDPGLVSARQCLVQVPAGMMRGGKPAAEPTLLESTLHQTAILRRLADELAATPGPARDEVRKHFFYSVQRSAACLALLKNMSAGPDLTQAQERIAAWQREPIYEKTRKRLAAEKEPAWRPLFAAAAFDPGRPCIVADTGEFVLQPVAAQVFLEKRTRSELVILIFISLLVISLFRHSLSIVQRLIPEIVLAMTLTAMAVFGAGLLGITLAALMVAVRALWLAQAVRLLRSQKLPDPASKSGVGIG